MTTLPVPPPEPRWLPEVPQETLQVCFEAGQALIRP